MTANPIGNLSVQRHFINLSYCISFHLIDSLGENGLSLLLEGKHAFISGGTRGIGAALCEVFAREGADIAFNYQGEQCRFLWITKRAWVGSF